MEGSKLLDLFRTLDKKEVRKLGQFLDSPLFNIRSSAIDLYKYLLREYPEFSRPKRLERAVVFKKLFSGEDYEDKGWKLRQAMQVLAQQIEQFLLWNKLQEDKQLQEDCLLEVYQERKLDKYFFNLNKQIEKDLEGSTIRDMHYYRRRLWSGYSHYFHPNINKLVQKNSGDPIDLLEERLDAFYWITKLRFGTELYFYAKIYGLDYDLSWFPSIKKAIQKSPFGDDPIFRIYTMLIGSIENLSDSNYQVLKQLVFENFTCYLPKDQTSILDILGNYVVFQINSGRQEYVKELVQIYKFGLQQNTFIFNGYIPVDKFMNMVNIAYAVKDYDWLSELIDDYILYVHEDMRQACKTLALVCLHFGQQQFQKVLSLLQEIDFEDFSFKFRVRSFFISTYFELVLQGQDYPLESECSSFRIFLSRQKKILNTSTITANQNFTTVVLKLYKFYEQTFLDKIYTDKNKQSLTNIEAELNEIKFIANKSWLLEKIAQLKSLNKKSST